MYKLRPSSLLLTLTMLSSVAFAQSNQGELPDNRLMLNPGQPVSGLTVRDNQGLPGLRPRMSMRIPLDATGSRNRSEATDSAFSWSLEAWQLNTASLAHIECNQHTLTNDSYLAQDCRFVDQPAPDDAINLVQVRGEWMAAPGLRLGVGAFRAQPESDYLSPAFQASSGSPDYLASSELGAQELVDGVDLNVSFGISTDHVGDFLVGLQLARYRQRLTLNELAFGRSPLGSLNNLELDSSYVNSAQLALGWRMGSFRGDVLGQHRQSSMLFSDGYSPAEFNSFDLEFSWQPKNGSLSIGVSNVLDSQPRSDDAQAMGNEDPLDQVFGRIPYVRYKHDL